MMNINDNAIKNQRLLNLIKKYKDGSFKEYVSSLSPYERYNCRNFLILYDYRNPEQTFFTKEELEQIIEIVRVVDSEAPEKRLSPFELSKSDKHNNMGIEFPITRKWGGTISWTYFADMMDECLSFHDKFLQFFLIMDTDEIIPFINADNLIAQTEMLNSCLRSAQKLKNEELIDKIARLLDVCEYKKNEHIHNLLNAYKQGKLVEFLKQFSPDERYGLRNAIILYDYRNPGHVLFGKEELTEIVETIKKVEEESMEKRTSPLALAEGRNFQIEEIQNLPEFGGWSSFKKYITGYWNRDLEKMLEFIAIMEIEEIADFMQVYYIAGKTQEEYETLVNYANFNSRYELSDKIAAATKLYYKKQQEGIKFYIDLLRSGKLSEFVLTLSENDRDNLKDFVRLFKLRYINEKDNNDLFTEEELKKIIETIETVDKSYNNKKQNSEGSDSNIGLSKLLGAYNRKKIKGLIQTAFENESYDRLLEHKDSIFEFLSIMSEDEILMLTTELEPKKAIMIYNNLKDMVLQEQKQLFPILPSEKLENIIEKINFANEKLKEKLAVISPYKLPKINVLREQIDEYMVSEEHKLLLSIIHLKNWTIFVHLYFDLKQNTDKLALFFADFIINITDEDDYKNIISLIDVNALSNCHITLQGIPLIHFAKRADLKEYLKELGFKEGEITPNPQQIEEIRKLFEETSGKHMQTGKRM